jgi:uncharacterized protein YegL
MTRPHSAGGGFEDSFGQPAANQATILPLVLLVDVSNSMNEDDGAGGTRVKLLVESLNRLLDELRDIGDARRGGEVAMITFGNGGVHRRALNAPGTPPPLGAFTRLTAAQVPELEASLGTPLAEALEAAADLVQERHEQLRGRLRFRANLWIFTDGQNTDAEGYFTSLPQASIERLRALENDRRLLVFACALPGANETELRRIAPRTTAPIRGMEFKEIVNLIVVSSNAAGRFSERPAEDIYRQLEDDFARFQTVMEP